MTIQEFRDYMASGKPVIGGSDVHMMFHQLSQEALKITAEINGEYHTPEELHDLLEQLWGREVPKTVGMFPPFHTDCGKNTVVGERVFINMGCKFQDQGGITIDEGASEYELCTYTHWQERLDWSQCHRSCWSNHWRWSRCSRWCCSDQGCRAEYHCWRCSCQSNQEDRSVTG